MATREDPRAVANGSHRGGAQSISARARAQSVTLALGRHLSQPRVSTLGQGLVLLALVVAFTTGWARGDLVLDGPGISIYVQLALDHIRDGNGVPYWVPDLWGGSPVWALVPSAAIFMLVPLGAAVGADRAVQIGSIAAEVVAAWGAFALARSLWGRGPAPLVAGVAYGLSPLLITFITAGHESSAWTMAALPWLIRSLRLGLRGGARRHIILAGLLAGFATLMQAELAYGLAMMLGCVWLLELAHARHGRSGDTTTAAVLRRSVAMAAIAGGLMAHWLLPFRSMQGAFILSPPELVRPQLFHGIGAELGRSPDAFLTRSRGVGRYVPYTVDFVHTGWFYIGAVAALLTIIAIALALRFEEDGSLTAILVPSAFCLWMSTASRSLANGTLNSQRNLVAYAALGLGVGVLLGLFVRHLVRGRRLLVIGGALLVSLLAAFPYLRPFLLLQQHVPLLSSLRFPRFYPIAAIGLSLGCAYPVAMFGKVLHEWVPSPPRLAATGLGFLVIAATLVDVWPYRSFYETHRIDSKVYEPAVAAVRSGRYGDRVGTINFGDPSVIAELSKSGRRLTVGWPHPVAGKALWRMTGEALFWPTGYRDQALAVSGTGAAVTALEKGSAPTSRPRIAVKLERVPTPLPFVRAYSTAVVVHDRALVAELAARLAPRGISVVATPSGVPDGLQSIHSRELGGSALCEHLPPPGRLAAEAAIACSKHVWLGNFEGSGLTGGPGVTLGAEFQAPLDGLRGLAIWLAGPTANLGIDLYELAPDGRTVGRLLAKGRPAPEPASEEGLTRFIFPQPVAARGKDLVWLLRCFCTKDTNLFVVSTDATRTGRGNWVVDGRVDRSRVLAFNVVYDGMRPVPAARTRVAAHPQGPGAWRLSTSGRPALVVVSEAWFPGWRATIDGRDATVVEADGGLLGVPVPAGAHSVELRFHRPPAAMVGRVVTGLTFVVCAVLLLPVSRHLPRVLQRRYPPRHRRRRGLPRPHGTTPERAA